MAVPVQYNAIQSKPPAINKPLLGVSAGFCVGLLLYHQVFPFVFPHPATFFPVKTDCTLHFIVLSYYLEIYIGFIRKYVKEYTVMNALLNV